MPPDGMPPDARTLWALIDERARTVPDALLAVDEHGRRLTFGEYRDGRSAAPRA